MRYRPRQVCLCDPNRLLSSLPRFSAHCHARSLLPTVVNHSTIYDENPDLHHGLLDPNDFWLHKFRATFATKHLQAGVDLRTVQLWLGHKDLESTMRYLKPARGKDVLTKVNATFA